MYRTAHLATAVEVTSDCSVSMFGFAVEFRPWYCAMGLVARTFAEEEYIGVCWAV